MDRPNKPSRHHGIIEVARLLQSVSDRKMLRLSAGIVVVVVASGALSALTPLVLKMLIDAVADLREPTSIGTRSTVLSSGLAYLLLLVIGRLLADGRPRLNGSINHRVHSRLAQHFFDHVLRLPMAFLLKRKSGELLHSLELASGGTQLVITHLVGSLLPVLAELFTMITVLINLGQPALLAVFVATAAVYLATFSVGARLMARTSREVTASSLEAHAQLSAGLTHFETLRYFAAEEQARLRFRGASSSLEQRLEALHRLNFMIALAASLTFAFSTAACLAVGVGAVGNGTMSLGGFVLTTVYMLQMVRPLETLGTAARDLSKALGYVSPFIDLMLEPLATDLARAPAGAAVVQIDRKIASAVRLENVHFGYDAERPIIKGIDLDVPAGRTTAIVGSSGSGKSTLARLLMGLYVPQRGRILLDGRTIDTIAASELRGSIIGLVPQETALLHETIAGNIALGFPTATREEIRAAACGAQLQNLVDALPHGLDTTVGERGMQLSGGERQRVGIARALLRRPGLYVLDEPTSMLDSKTESHIQLALRSLSSDATKIVIAHRLSTIVDADQIVVLEDGQILERGSHRALLEMGGLYARMWLQQTAGAA
jgi:ABC-type multidrug transport system fused ATPase/permease subunit